MALAERRTAAAGGGQATVSTPTGVWTELTTAMVNAGWVLDTDWSAAGAWPAWAQNTAYALGAKVTANGNRYYAIAAGTSASSGAGPTSTTTLQADGTTLVWEYQSTSATTADAIYSSTGESGNERLWARVWVNTNFVNIEMYQHFASNIKYNAFNPARTQNIAANQKNQQFDYTGATTINFAVIADKDSVMMTTVSQANVRRTIAFGNLRRFPGVIATHFVSNNSVTVGTNRTFTFSSGNPVAAGYRVGSPIMVVSQQTTGSANFVIPCFSSRITAVTTNSITVANVPEAVSAGALVGHDPMPYYCIHTLVTASNPFNSNGLSVHNYNDDSVTNVYAVNGQVGLNTSLNIPIRNPAVAELDPNNRTGYFQVIEQMAYVSDSHPRGFMTKAYAWHTNANNQWTIAREVRVAARDWLFQRDTPPSTGSAWITGPFTATAATVSFQSLSLTDWGYQELDILPTLNQGQDRGLSGNVPSNTGELSGYRFHSSKTWGRDEVDYIDWVNIIYPQPAMQGRWFQANLFTSEPYPFDSSVATLGGSSNGFNTGFN